MKSTLNNGRLIISRIISQINYDSWLAERRIGCGENFTDNEEKKKIKISTFPIVSLSSPNFFLTRGHDKNDFDGDVITQTWPNGKAPSLGCEQDSLSYTCDENLKAPT